MWKLKLASTVMGGPDIGSVIGGKKETHYNKWARLCGLIAAAVTAALGILGIFVKPMWTGFYSIGISILIAILEIPFAPFAPMAKLLNIFQDYRFRIGFYVIICIVTFFNLATVFGGLACLVTAGFYGFCLYKGEQGKLISPAFPIAKVGEVPTQQGEEMKAKENTDSNNKKKFSLASLGIV